MQWGQVMARNTSWKRPLKEGRIQIGEGKGGKVAGFLVTGGPRKCGNRERTGRLCQWEREEVGNKLLLVEWGSIIKGLNYQTIGCSLCPTASGGRRWSFSREDHNCLKRQVLACHGSRTTSDSVTVRQCGCAWADGVADGGRYWRVECLHGRADLHLRSVLEPAIVCPIICPGWWKISLWFQIV